MWGVTSAEQVATRRAVPRASTKACEAFRKAEARLGHRLKVLIYHRVAQPTIDPWAMSVSPDNFAEHISVLTTNGRVTLLEHELRRRSYKRPSRSERRFAITFDDGYVDNLTTALPILERFDVPATIFVTTAYIDQPYFWWDRLADLVLHEPVDRAAISAVAHREGFVGFEDLDTPGVSAAALHERLYRWLVPRAPDERARFLDDLADALAFTAPHDAGRPLSTAELLELAAHPLITIGAHTHRHPRLATLPAEEALEEVVEGRRNLELLLGVRQRLFAYPHGNATKGTARLVGQAGYQFAFTTVSRPVSLLDRRLLLPRIATSDVGGAEFARLRGLTPVGAAGHAIAPKMRTSA